MDAEAIFRKNSGTIVRLESWASEEYAKAEAASALSVDVYPFSGVVYEH